MYHSINEKINLVIPKMALDYDLPQQAYLLLDVIYRKCIYRNKIKKVNLMNKFLRQLVGYDYIIPVREKLIKLGIIHCDMAYEVGKKSFTFSLSDKALQSGSTMLEVHKKTVVNAYKRNVKPITNPVHIALLKKFQDLEFDYDGAYALLKSLKLSSRKRYYHNAILLKFLHKTYSLTYDERGRVYSLVTYLPSIYRKFLSVKGERLVNLDITNSQPLILNILIKQEHIKNKNNNNNNIVYHNEENSSPVDDLDISNSQPLILIKQEHIKNKNSNNNIVYHNEENSSPVDDFEKYEIITSIGLFYDYMIKKSNWTQSRDLFKRKLFQVYYGKNNQSNALTKMFQETFPEVFNFIKTFKNTDYKKLSLEMQRTEANLIIECICKRAINEYPDMPIYTIHDSILTTPRYTDTLEQIIDYEFMKQGVDPHIRIKDA